MLRNILMQVGMDFVSNSIISLRILTRHNKVVQSECDVINGFYVGVSILLLLLVLFLCLLSFYIKLKGMVFAVGSGHRVLCGSQLIPLQGDNMSGTLLVAA